jgi:hypothetical protein
VIDLARILVAHTPYRTAHHTGVFVQDEPTQARDGNGELPDKNKSESVRKV